MKKGSKHTPESIKKCRIAKIGKYVGIKLSQKTISLMSAAKKKTWEDPDYRSRMEKLYGDPEWKRRKGDIARVVLSNPITKQKMSESGKKSMENPERRAKALQALRSEETLRRKREANAKPEFKENAREKQKQLWKNPEYRERQLKVLSEAKLNPEYRKKASESAKKRFEDPEELKKMSERTRKRFSDPNERVASSIAHKKIYEDPDYRKRVFGNRSSHEYRQMQRDLQSRPDIQIRKKEGEVGGFWYGNVRYPETSYCDKFNKEFKERVRAFRGYVCFECGTPQNGHSLPVHHVHYDKQMCCNGSPQDVIPLCPSCHSIANHDRDYWEEHFTYLLYAWNPNGKCFFTREEMFAYTGVRN